MRRRVHGGADSGFTAGSSSPANAVAESSALRQAAPEAAVFLHGVAGISDAAPEQAHESTVDEPASVDLPGSEEVERGQSMLARISNEVVKTFKEYHGKGPTSAKSYMLDDMLFVVMRGGLNAAEKFLLEKGEVDVVRQYRQTFENRMDEILTGKIEELTGRKVIAFNSQILFDPDMSVEIFVFDDRGTEESIDATALGQIAGKAVGEIRGEGPTATHQVARTKRARIAQRARRTFGRRLPLR